MTEIEQFVEMILDKKGLRLEPEIRRGIITDLGVRLANRINRDLINALSDEEFEQVERLVDQGRLSEVQAVIEASSIDQRAITAQAMIAFGQDYLGKK